MRVRITMTNGEQADNRCWEVTERKITHVELSLPVELWLCVYLYTVSEKKEKLSGEDPKKLIKCSSFRVLQF